MNRPGRLHHHAYVSRNLETTRQFYEDAIVPERREIMERARSQ